MIQQKALLDWQREQAEDQRDWQAEQARLADARHGDNLKLVADATKWNLRGALFNAAILAVATLAAAALASWLTWWVTSGPKIALPNS